MILDVFLFSLFYNIFMSWLIYEYIKKIDKSLTSLLMNELTGDNGEPLQLVPFSVFHKGLHVPPCASPPTDSVCVQDVFVSLSGITISSLRQLVFFFYQPSLSLYHHYFPLDLHFLPSISCCQRACTGRCIQICFLFAGMW